MKNLSFITNTKVSSLDIFDNIVSSF